MKKFIRSLVSLTLCAACAVPAFNVVNAAAWNAEPDYYTTRNQKQNVVIESEKFSYNSDEALLNSDMQETYYFVTGFGDYQVAWNFEHDIPCVYFTGVNDAGEILIRNCIQISQLKEMFNGDVADLKAGDIIELTPSLSESKLTAWGAYDTYVEYVDNCKWILQKQDVPIKFDMYKNHGNVSVTGNLIDIWGSDAVAMLETENKFLRDTNVMEHQYTVNRVWDPETYVPWEFVGEVDFDDFTEIINILGDVNFDGAVDIIDAIKINKYNIGVTELDSNQIQAGDVDKNGTVDSSDSLAVVKYAVGMIDSFTEADKK